MARRLKKGDRVKRFGRMGTIVRLSDTQDYTAIVHWDDTGKIDFVKTWDLEKVEDKGK